GIKIDAIPEETTIDHAIEGAGGIGSQYAIDQIIDYINPEGTISLLGVSEYPVEVNTRMVLEKGLTLYGSSRSGSADFQRTIELSNDHVHMVTYLSTLIEQTYTVKSIEDIRKSFDGDLSSAWRKTVMRWKILIVIKESLEKTYITCYKVIF